ncbi:alpha/beta fold hydrolase [Methylocella sp.]|uniref:alpha/beta fold hydrolase n=1 Tax=Methylocella sp. TaxID=1978226 RepID=UPI003783F235
MKQEILTEAPSAGSRLAPILFVHGAYCGAWIWAEHFLDYFARQGHPTYAVSLRGHGLSEGDLSRATFDNYVDDVARVAAAIDGEPIVVGHSMGGLVAQHYAARSDGKARALVAVSSAPPSGLRSSALHMTMFAPDVLFQLALLQSLGPRMASPAVIARALFSPQSAPALAGKIVERLQRESPIASAELFAPPSLDAATRKAQLPTLSIGGDADVFLPRSAFQEIADAWRGDLEILAGAPHALMLDPLWRDVAAARILAWLRKRVGS